jgi:hypothetical protein
MSKTAKERWLHEYSHKVHKQVAVVNAVNLIILTAVATQWNFKAPSTTGWNRIFDTKQYMTQAKSSIC